MGVRILLFRAPLPDGSLVITRLAIGDEDRVVAESALTVSFGREAAGPDAPDDLLTVTVNERDDGYELRRPVRVSHVRELVEQELEVFAPSFACPAQYAEKTPGEPPRTSTQMPESSASAGRPV